MTLRRNHPPPGRAAGHAAAPRPVERSVEAGGLRWQLQHWTAAAAPAEPQPLLLLHGTGASSHSWARLAPLLAAHGELLVADLPGHARSGPLPAARRSLPGMAAATADLLRTLGVHPRAVLGHSAGAAVMLRMALDGQLDGTLDGPPGGCTLIGLNAALQPFDGWAGFLFPPLARLLSMNPLVPRLAAWRARDERVVRRLIDATGSTLGPEAIARYAQLMRNPHHVAGALAMTANWDLGTLQRDLRQRLRRPLHLLVGQADGTVPPQQAERLAAAQPLVRLQRLPGLGHLAHEEAPQAVAERVLPLLGALPLSPQRG